MIVTTYSNEVDCVRTVVRVHNQSDALLATAHRFADQGLRLVEESNLLRAVNEARARNASTIILHENAIEALRYDNHSKQLLVEERQQRGISILALVPGEIDQDHICLSMENLPVDVVASYYGGNEIVDVLTHCTQNVQAFTPTFPPKSCADEQHEKRPIKPVEILTGITGAGKTTLDDLLFDYLDIAATSAIEPIIRVKIATDRNDRRRDDRVERERTIIVPNQEAFTSMKREGTLALDYTVEEKDVNNDVVRTTEYGSRTPNKYAHELYTSRVPGAIRLLEYYGVHVKPANSPVMSARVRPMRVFGLDVRRDESFQRVWERMRPENRTKEAFTRRETEIRNEYIAYQVFLERSQEALGESNVVRIPSYATSEIRALMPQQESEEPLFFRWNVKRYLARYLARAIAQNP